MRRVRANTVAAEKQEVLHIIYHSRNTHAPYCIVICDLSGCTEILHIISETARLSKKKKLLWNIYRGVSHFKKNSARCFIYRGFQVKVSFILVGFYLNLNFLDSFSNCSLVSNFMKIRPVIAELCNAGGQVDRCVVVAFAVLRKSL